MLYVSDIGTNETQSVALDAKIISATDLFFRLFAFFSILQMGCKQTSNKLRRFRFWHIVDLRRTSFTCWMTHAPVSANLIAIRDEKFAKIVTWETGWDEVDRGLNQSWFWCIFLKLKLAFDIAKDQIRKNNIVSRKTNWQTEAQLWRIIGTNNWWWLRH